jgi:hypothetical protein
MSIVKLDKCETCGHEEILYGTGVEKFEAAIREFGVDAALEYFGTSEEIFNLFDNLKSE